MTFDEFLPDYLAAHAHPATRVIHAGGTILGLTIVGTAIARKKPALVPLGLVAGYLPAWCSHWFIEHNTPKTFGHPLYALRGDLVMLGRTLRGKLTEESSEN
jgi:hypothetical protein